MLFECIWIWLNNDKWKGKKSTYIMITFQLYYRYIESINLNTIWLAMWNLLKLWHQEMGVTLSMLRRNQWDAIARTCHYYFLTGPLSSTRRQIDLDTLTLIVLDILTPNTEKSVCASPPVSLCVCVCVCVWVRVYLRVGVRRVHKYRYGWLTPYS